VKAGPEGLVVCIGVAMDVPPRPVIFVYVASLVGFLRCPSH